MQFLVDPRLQSISLMEEDHGPDCRGERKNMFITPKAAGKLLTITRPDDTGRVLIPLVSGVISTFCDSQVN